MSYNGQSVNFKDLTGERFRKLKVIKRSFPNAKDGEAMWLCKCDCGTEKVIMGKSLRSGNTKSCGCLNKFKSGLSSMRRKIAQYRIKARQRGLKYNLTEGQFAKLTKQDCYYCGAEPNNISNDPGHNGSYTYNGLDRVDNTKGYTIDNVVPCCKICNMSKNNMTLQEFKDWAERVSINLKKKEE